MESIIEIYEKNGFKAQRKSTVECCGSCPICGGNDRFILRNDDKGERFFCRKCGIIGGAMKLARIIKDSAAYSPAQGGVQASETTTPKHSASIRKKRIALPQPPITYQPYLDFAETFANSIGHPMAEKILERRGITVETARKYGLGFSDGSTWYVPAGKEKKNCFPAGIVISNKRCGTLRSMKVRRLNTENGKYMTPFGCPQMPFIIQENDNGNTPLFIVESELDAVLMAQECGRFFNYIALGSATNAPDTDVADMISRAGKVFFCADYDEEGMVAFRTWKQHFPRIELAVLPKGKDPTEAKQLGVDLKAWALGIRGIGPKQAPVTRELSLSYDTVATEEGLAACVQRMVDSADGAKVNMAFCHDPRTDRCSLSDGKTAVVGSRALFPPVISAFGRQCRIITHDPCAFRLGWGDTSTMTPLEGTRFMQMALTGEDKSVFELSNRYFGHCGGSPSLTSITEMPPDKSLAYDAYAISQLFDLLLPKLTDNRGSRNFYVLLRDAQEAVTQMMRFGLSFNWDKLGTEENELDAYARYAAEDSRVHATINPCHAITGRMTSSNPCLHSIPNIIKHLVIPQEGYVFVDADFKQSELRLAAELSKDEILRSLLVKGKDCHAATAARIFEKVPSKITSDEREIGKAANFGFLYGQDGKGLYYKLVKDDIYHEDDPDAREHYIMCERAKQQFAEQFPALTKWLKAQKDRCRKRCYMDYPHGGVRTAIGRVIPLIPLDWLWENKVGNYIVQGTGAELMLATLGRLPALLRELGGRILLSVYDEILLEVPEENAEAAVKATEEAIRQAFSVLFPDADTSNLADIHIGRTWAEAKGK